MNPAALACGVYLALLLTSRAADCATTNATSGTNVHPHATSTICDPGGTPFAIVRPGRKRDARAHSATKRRTTQPIKQKTGNRTPRSTALKTERHFFPPPSKLREAVRASAEGPGKRNHTIRTSGKKRESLQRRKHEKVVAT